MLPHVNAKNQEQGGLASPGKTKGKTLHTPSPGLVKATGDLAEELSQRTLKRLQPNLKAVIVSGKTPWTRRACLQQKNAFPLGSRSQCLLQAGQLCLGQQALSRNTAVLNLWSNRKPLEGWKFTLNMVQSKEHAKGIWSVLENMGSEHPPHTLSSLPAKSRWNYHSRVVLWFLYMLVDVPTNIPPVGDTGTLVQPILPSPATVQPQGQSYCTAHTCWHHCWLSHCANRISE